MRLLPMKLEDTMNNAVRESNSIAAPPSRSAPLDSEPLHALKRDLAAGAEVDIKVLTARLKAITK